MQFNLENMNNILNNNQNAYYGHGTNGDIDTINSIFNIGLRCSHGSMYFTTCVLGRGGELGNDIFEMLNNWPHLEAEKIIIVSAPIKYNILDTASLHTYHLAANAYCYQIEGRGNFVMPEFVVGCYDAKTKTFSQNTKYYELLPKEEQTKLFEQVKKNYAETIENACGLEYYKGLLEELPGWEYPLTEEETHNLINSDSKKII